MIRTAKNCKTQGRRRAAGFTLVELLVVIAIVALLSGILFPAIGRAKDLARAAATQNRITSLDGACEMFKQDHNAYPGLNRWPLGSHEDYLLLDALNSDLLTGSQVLAMCLLDLYAERAGDWTPMSDHLKGDHAREPRPYVNLGEDAVDINGSITGVPYTIVDAFDKPMPILYFPGRPGQIGRDAIYRFEDNEGTAPYPPAVDSQHDNDPLKAHFQTLITNPASPTLNGKDRPYREDSFLLVAPGIDRLWFNDDDNRNFNQ